MKKQLVCIFMSILLLAGCSGTGEKTNQTDTTASVADGSGISDTEKTETGSNDTAVDSSEFTATGTFTIGTNDSGENDPILNTNVDNPADDPSMDNSQQNHGSSDVNSEEPPITIGISIPPLPEEGLPDIPSGKVQYTDDSVIIYEDEEGDLYVNGESVSPEEMVEINQQIASAHLSQILETATSDTDIPVLTTPATTTTEPYFPDITIPDDIYTETTRPEGTIQGSEDIFYLAKYVKTGNTDLSITDIKVYNSARPGIEGVDSFKPGESMLINLLCNPEARMDSKVYIVPESADHKDSYSPTECLLSEDMFIAFESGVGQLFMEITLPDKIAPGVYEVRFVCGTEEGYIPFHLG